jgi:hypothetical protein
MVPDPLRILKDYENLIKELLARVSLLEEKLADLTSFLND